MNIGREKGVAVGRELTLEEAATEPAADSVAQPEGHGKATADSTPPALEASTPLEPLVTEANPKSQSEYLP